MNRCIARFCVWVGFCVVTAMPVPQALAQVAPPEILDGARLMYETEIEDGDYRLVTSSIKKVNGQWRAEKMQLLSGAIERETYELKQALGYGQVKRRLLEFYGESPSYSLVFKCDGLDCGSSSGWANEYLNVKQLYGMDAFQNYSVWETRGSEGEGYVALYLVQRGNKRIYLQRDQISLKGASAKAPDLDAVEQSLARHGHYRIPGFSLDAAGAPRVSAQSLATLRAYLERNKSDPVRLVGHDYSGGSLESEQEKSALYATYILQMLREAGVATDAISAHGVGSLAPITVPGQPRVELVRGG